MWTIRMKSKYARYDQADRSGRTVTTEINALSELKNRPNCGKLHQRIQTKTPLALRHFSFLVQNHSRGNSVNLDRHKRQESNTDGNVSKGRPSKTHDRAATMEDGVNKEKKIKLPRLACPFGIRIQRK